ncbi:MAG: NADH-quinone oxidoreductase subunit L [Candidatus Kapaibacterium sp.]
MIDLIYLVPLLPLIGFFIVGLFGKKLKSESLVGGIASAAVGGAFVVAVSIFVSMLGHGPEERSHIVRLFTWMQAGNFSIDISYQVDQLSILYTLIITGIGTLIHIYSIGYMHGDKGFPRFFAYLNLFIFMMLNLVLASNFLLTFLGWEGVGLCSYLLIGFWHDRKFEGSNIVWTGDAAKKAFIVNRIGDFGVLVAMFLIYSNFHTLNYAEVNSQAAAGFPIGSGLITAITLLLFLGCTGKSAQIPLGIWLPDAMAGPTPVSALIHAATMVTAGIFLIARNATMFALSPTTMAVVTGIGITTALTAALVGLVQNDIKKVLAYSTVSQLGFMFVALGVGAFTAGVFHVMTHAFFKALLFLGSGSVIHGMHEEQDIQRMGGLKKYMPTTYKTFLIGTIAIAGIFPFAGFFSKDEILWNAFSQGSPILWGVGVLAAFCTAFYMFRLLHLTFHGKERFDHHHVHPHESPISMTFPLMVLAVLSVLGGFLGIPYALSFGGSIPNILEHWLEPIFAPAMEILHRPEVHEVHAIEYVLMAASLGIAIMGIMLAGKFYKTESDKPQEMATRFSGMYKVLWNKWFIDEIYQGLFVNTIYTLSNSFLWKIFDVKIVDGIVNGSARVVAESGELLRKIQSGIAQNYALMMMVGIVAILVWLGMGS